MNIRVLYFASLREALACEREDFALSEAVRDVAGLRSVLVARGAPWDALNRATVRAAVNQVMATPQTPVKVGDEVAFFPPVTGG